jgi:hypothetical protein
MMFYGYFLIHPKLILYGFPLRLRSVTAARQKSAVTDYRCTVVFYDIFKDIFWSWLVLVWAFRTKDFPRTRFKYDKYVPIQILGSRHVLDLQRVALLAQWI